MAKKNKDIFYKFGELAILKNLAKPEDVGAALATQQLELEEKKSAPKLGRILVENKILTNDDVREILEEQKIGRGIKNILRIDLREQKNGIIVLYLKGRLDSEKYEMVKRVFEKLMNKGIIKIVVNCNKLVYLDGKGASSFIHYIDETRSKCGDIKFSNMRPQIRCVFDKLGLSKFIQIFSNETIAIASFGKTVDEFIHLGALGEYVSALGSKYFHFSYCASAQNILPNSRVFYQSREHALGAGKTCCLKCKP